MRVYLFSFVLVLLTACATRRPDSVASQATDALRPFFTATPSPTSTPALQVAETPLPTATPFTYTVQKGDTLSGIAEKFRIRLETLQAANPGISPGNMPVGTVLKVPAEAGLSAVLPSPTPVLLPVQQAVCYASTEGGLWCFVLVHNNTPDPIENLSAQVTLYASDGQLLAGETSSSLLNLLPAGASFPLAVFFTGNLPANVVPRVQILTATRLPVGERRYLPVSLENVQTSIDWSGRRAQTGGKIFLATDAASPAEEVWIAAVAYAADGRVTGVRRWESAVQIPAGGRLDFAFNVFSAGPPIERLELFVEAHSKE